MDEKVAILIVGTNQPIIKTIARLIEKNDKWTATIVFSLDEVKEICLTNKFNLLLIGAGLTDLAETQLKNYVSEDSLKIPFVTHYGGGSGLLYAEIYEGLEGR